MGLLSKDVIDDRFCSVKEEVDHYWKEEKFHPYTLGRSDASILKEYQKVDDLRNAYKGSFEHPKSLLESKSYCHIECLSFAHSIADETYNCSCIDIGSRRFFALEGPTKQTMPIFLDLVDRWRVAYLVSLTDEHDSTSSFPYWVNRTENEKIILKNGHVPFHLRTDWKDHHPSDPQQLLNSVSQVRANVTSNELIAVHCTGGVGRTGTLITTLCLIDQLEQGQTPSIGSLVLYLNLFRPKLVSNHSQYLSLYRTLDYYFSLNR